MVNIKLYDNFASPYNSKLMYKVLQLKKIVVLKFRACMAVGTFSLAFVLNSEPCT